MWLVHAKGSFGTDWLVADESLGTDWPRSSERFGTAKNGKISPTLCEDRRWCVKGAYVGIRWDRLTLEWVTEAPWEDTLPASSYFLYPAADCNNITIHWGINTNTNKEPKFLGLESALSWIVIDRNETTPYQNHKNEIRQILRQRLLSPPKKAVWAT